MPVLRAKEKRSRNEVNATEMKNEDLEASYPLSPMQQGMLLHGLHDRDGGAYIQQMVCVLSEPVAVPLLVKAWQHLITRHAQLRTSFWWAAADGPGDEPIQQVHRHADLTFTIDDWSSSDPEAQQQRLTDILKSDRHRGFELSAAPLMRVSVLKWGETDYRMVWTFHHALLDGRSHLLLLRELFDGYERLQAGRQLDDLEQPRPYSEYIDWLEQQDLAKAEVFWRAALSGFSSPTSLRVEATRTSDRRRQKHALAEILLSEKLTAELRRSAKENEVTLNNLVQAAWALLLS